MINEGAPAGDGYTSINIQREMIVPASGTSVNETRNQYYIDQDSLRRRETRTFESQSDTSDYSEYRESDDNGKTWGEWQRLREKTREKVGEDELAEFTYHMCRNVWNPVHRHYLSVTSDYIYVGGYEKAVENWMHGGIRETTHTYIDVRDEAGKTVAHQLLKYEDGDDFDKSRYRQTNYLSRNISVGTDISILKNGDILIGICAPVDVCCKRAGLDISKVFPSSYKQTNAFMAARGEWNQKLCMYRFSFSDPVVLDDRVSSRGIVEPVMAELSSGRILLVFRMSNARFSNWNSRISPYAPGYKMYSLSEDGGKTFSPPMPWHFDTREVIYSSATYSLLIRSEKNGKLYWFGNITDPAKINGNAPRYPLYMVEVDEEWGCAKKDTLVLIETKRAGESDDVQLSNFCILQDRETHNMELFLTKYAQFPEKHIRDCEVWKYTITL